LTGPEVEPYASFTLKGFDDQERNLTFVKTDFRVLNAAFDFPLQ